MQYFNILRELSTSISRQQLNTSSNEEITVSFTLLLNKIFLLEMMISLIFLSSIFNNLPM